MGYAPRIGSQRLLSVIQRLCNANRSDTCIVSGDKLRNLMFAWDHEKRSRRWIWYHLKALVRDHYLLRQTRWKAIGGKIVIKARTRYRVTWRTMQHYLRHARHGLKLAAFVGPGARLQTVQKIALGLETLLRSVVPAPA